MRLFSLQTEKSKTRAAVLLVVVWLIAISIGGFAHIQYSLASPTTHAVADLWPETTSISKTINAKQLLIFLHPKCVCSFASVSELSKVQEHAKEPIHVKAIFFCPEGESRSWAQGDLWTATEAIENCEYIVDVGAVETKNFGVETSGHVLLFDEQGRRIFSGGVTSSRGHIGDNLGVSTLVDLIHGGVTSADELPVFGCKLLGEETANVRVGGRRD